MMVDVRSKLPLAQTRAQADRDAAELTFRKWAARYTEAAWYMNVGSGTQVQTLLSGGSYLAPPPHISHISHISPHLPTSPHAIRHAGADPALRRRDKAKFGRGAAAAAHVQAGASCL